MRRSNYKSQEVGGARPKDTYSTSCTASSDNRFADKILVAFTLCHSKKHKAAKSMLRSTGATSCQHKLQQPCLSFSHTPGNCPRLRQGQCGGDFVLNLRQSRRLRPGARILQVTARVLKALRPMRTWRWVHGVGRFSACLIPALTVLGEQSLPCIRCSARDNCDHPSRPCIATPVRLPSILWPNRR